MNQTTPPSPSGRPPGTPPPTPATAAGAPPPAPASRRNTFLIIAGSLVVFGVAFWLVIFKLPGLLMGPRTSPPENPPAQTSSPSAEARRIRVSLFYVSDTGLELSTALREIPFGATPSEQARLVVEAQIQPPPPGVASPIPAGTTLRSVYLAPTGEAFVDFGPEIVTNHSGGSLAEALTVYAIVNALSTSLPSVTSVQILIDGKQVETLAGHIDLRRPLTLSLDWVRKGR